MEVLSHAEKVVLNKTIFRIHPKRGAKALKSGKAKQNYDL